MRRDGLGAALAKALTTGVVGCVVLAGCGSDKNLSGVSPAPTGPVDCGGKSDLTAEGSTAQQNAIALFNKEWAELCPGKNIAYNPTGSGAGREQFIARHVDFAGSESPLSREQIEPATQRCNGNPAWHLPMVFGPVALAYHVDGVTSLVLNSDVLAKIFSGVITDWSDPAIAALNAGVALPDSKITPIYRSDSSGTTDNFQKYLAAAAPNSWTKGAGSEFQGGVGEGAQKSAGIVQAVKSTPGAIGYVEKGFADQSGLPYARIDSGRGGVALTDDAARKAIDGATFAGDGDDLKLDLKSIYSTTVAGAYPLVLATYEIVCSDGYDASTSAAVKSFFTIAADNGQGGLSAAGYVPLPDKFKQRLLAAIRAIQ
ncbi:phosphate ABC transporter substrate-binding protein PstS [Mycobacterium cookii]|uniref:Phosphate-binding protein n=1 Tax=Mycobacterium cookii TaxID=1775 RepID=A0A7I7KY57_9MYCO|nr:phosphate ABC transporter substrate-binding protein PstS [Mycobacterium cookii]MCV7332344.1 phosphate ABC transporter substrate-binding protein PstS [Mycobacterium cookii]BBX46491.1 phosphate-binding protein PstS [Mycobacterium cookii]